jgi:hypothetical protein
MVLGCGLWVSGCGNDEVPSPQFNEGIRVGSRTLLPTVAPIRKDSATILGAAASAEEVGAGKPAAGEAAANVVKIQIDDSTPEGLLKGFVAIIESGNLAQLADIAVPEQQAVVRQLVGAIGPLMKATKALETTWKEKFPDTPLPGMQAGAPGMNLTAVPKFTDLEMKGDDEAMVTVENPQGGQAEKILLKRIDNAWRMQDSNMQMPADPEMLKKFLGVFGEFAKALQDIVSRLEKDEFTSPEEVQAALQQASQQIFAPIMSMMVEQMQKQFQGPTPPAEEKPAPETLQPAPKKKAPPSAKQPKQREPDAVDGTYTGPGMLRNR